MNFISTEHFQDLDTSGVRLLSRVGAATVYFSVVGTYTYRISNAVDGFSSCSILVNPGSKVCFGLQQMGDC